MSKLQQRQLDFSSFDEAIAEVNLLKEQGYTKTGNWNLTQISEHLIKTMEGGMNGFGFRMPWIFRKTLGAWMISSALRKRSFKNGTPTAKLLVPKEIEKDKPNRIKMLTESLGRARDFEGPMAPYPLCDGMTVEKWKDLMLIHASHHLGFLIANEPKAESEGPIDQTEEVTNSPAEANDEN